MSDDRSRVDRPDGGDVKPGAERRSRRRAPSQWDVRPEGYVEGASIAPTTSSAAPISGGGLAALGLSGSAPSMQTRHARRLYVGGLGEVPERDIEAFFAELVRKAIINKDAIRGNPILSVYLNPERKFAFVEFNSIELANAFMDLDGLLFKGHPVKIRRPNDYNPSVLPFEVREKKEPLDFSQVPMSSAPGSSSGGGGGGMGGMGGGGGGGLHRIYIGNISPALTEAQLLELVSAFGAVRKLDFLRTPEGMPRGYGFVEYVDPAVTDTAIGALDNLTVGDRNLTVSRAKSATQAVAAPTDGYAGAPGATGSNTMPLGQYGHAAPAPPLPTEAPVSFGAPSRVVCLENMVLPEELMTDTDYREILEDITSECGKYGALVQVVIPRPPAPGVGRVFLQYADVPGATNSVTSLSGRQFASRFIIAKYYDEGALRAGILNM